MSDEIRVVRGVPTDDELAAIVGVLFASRSGAPAPPARPESRWARSARPGSGLRRGARGSWQASGRPG